MTIDQYKQLASSNSKRRAKFSKYRAKPTTIDGIRFHSKLESECYLILKSLWENKKISFFLMQVPFRFPNNSKHYIDYCIFMPSVVIFLEAKGKDLPLGKFKREQIESLYNIKIRIVKKPQEIYEMVSS